MQLQRTARRKRVATSLVAGAALSLLAVGPAMASHEDGWAPANAGTTVEDGTIVLDTTDEDETPLGTSYETQDLGVELETGDVISFDYALSEGATCGGGQPRVFVEVDGTYYNTFDGNDDACGGEDGTVTYTYDGETGDIEHAGVVFDNISDRGVARVTNVSIGDYALDLEHDEDDEDDEGDEDPRADARDACKDGGWEEQGFRNQGQCIRFANTGKDSR